MFLFNRLFLLTVVAVVLTSSAIISSPVLADKPTASEIYNLTQKAKTAKDFSTIIEKCELANEGVEEGVDAADKNATDIDALKAWALGRRGLQRMELALSIRNAGNMQQFAAVVNAAMVDFNDSIAIDDSKWKPYFGRAIAFANTDKTDRAIVDLDKAISLNPKSMKAKFNRAELLSWQKEYEKAIADYLVVVAADPDDVQAINGLAFAELFSGKTDEAIKRFDRVVELQPDNATAYQNRAEAFQTAGNWKRAHADLLTSIERQATADSYLKTAWLLSTCPDPDFFQPSTALAMAKKGEAFDKDSVTTLEVMAAASAANGAFKTAVELQEKAISKIDSVDYMRVDSEEMKVRLATYESEEVYLQKTP